MNQRIRRKLDMAARVRDFVRAHPADNSPGYAAAAERLDDRVLRAELLAQRYVSGRTTVTGAVETRIRLRRAIAGSLSLLAGLGHRAAETDAELARSLSRATAQLSNPEFLTAARVTLGVVSAHRELLQGLGLPDQLVAELGDMLDRFEVALNDKHNGQSTHVGARAELEVVTAEIMSLVRQLDALNQFRFRNDAEALGAWRSARNVAWPTDKPAPPSGDGEVQPAA
jgi:hypothetical protein